MSGKKCHRLVALFNRWSYSLVECRREAGETFDPDHEQPSGNSLYLAAEFAAPPSAGQVTSALQRVKEALETYDGHSVFLGHALLETESWSKLTNGIEARIEASKAHEGCPPNVTSFGSVNEAMAKVPGMELVSPVLAS